MFYLFTSIAINGAYKGYLHFFQSAGREPHDTRVTQKTFKKCFVTSQPLISFDILYILIQSYEKNNQNMLKKKDHLARMIFY